MSKPLLTKNDLSFSVPGMPVNGTASGVSPAGSTERQEDNVDELVAEDAALVDPVAVGTVLPPAVDFAAQ